MRVLLQAGHRPGLVRYWKDYCEKWLLSLGINKENLRLRDHEPAELAFYSRATTDIEYAFPFTDWGELWGIADRTNYDLGRHQEASGKSWNILTPKPTSITFLMSLSLPWAVTVCTGFPVRSL